MRNIPHIAPTAFCHLQDSLPRERGDTAPTKGACCECFPIGIHSRRRGEGSPSLSTGAQFLIRTDVSRRVRRVSAGLELAEARRRDGRRGEIAEDDSVISIVELPAHENLCGVLGCDGLAVVDPIGEISLDDVDPGEAVGPVGEFAFLGVAPLGVLALGPADRVAGIPMSLRRASPCSSP